MGISPIGSIEHLTSEYRNAVKKYLEALRWGSALEEFSDMRLYRDALAIALGNEPPRLEQARMNEMQRELLAARPANLVGVKPPPPKN